MRIAKKETPTEVKQSIRSYNASLQNEDNKICVSLMNEINQRLTGAESKVWHGHPVWFLNGNPIVGYGKLKDTVQLLFWSGQTFKEWGLTNEGSFKAAEKRYTSRADVNIKDVRRWLKKAKLIQWDYKNIIKRRGKLVRL